MKRPASSLRSVATQFPLVALLCLTGCGPQAGNPAGPPAVPTADKSGGAKPASEVKLDIASWDEVQKVVAGHKGKVVVLDLWSSSCEPCVKELPGLVKLHQDHPEQVVCLSLNLDYIGLADEPPESHRESATKILAEKGAVFQNFISSEADEEVCKKVGVAAVPVVFVYGRDGQLAKRFDNEANEYGQEGFTYTDHIAPLVRDLVKPQP